MSNQVTGRVQHLKSRNIGRNTFHSMALADQEGWYGLPPFKPLPDFVKEGATISFTSFTNQKGYLEVEEGSLKPVEGAQSAQKATNSYSSGGDARQVSIISQVAFKAAVDVVLKGMETDGLKKPAKMPYNDFVATQVASLSAQFMLPLLEIGVLNPEEALMYIQEVYGLGPAMADNEDGLVKNDDEGGM